MKISAKGRYGLAAMTYLACNYAAGTPITIVSISEKLGISTRTIQRKIKEHNLPF